MKKRNPKFDKSNKKSPSNNEEVERNSKGKSKYDNDASWYTRNSQLALDAGRLAFTWPTGATVDFGFDSTVLAENEDSGKFRFPGVMELPYYPTFGTAKNADDPVNISMFNIYSWVRHINSGHVNYDSPDLMLYLLAMDSIYMYYQHMVRVYGCARLYAQRNRNLPLALFKALHVDYNDILNNLADFRAYINVCALKVGSMVVPATMPLFVRHMWMSSGVYSDSPSIKSQFYVFRPAVVGKYNERSSETGGFLDAEFTTNDTTFAAMKSRMDSLIAAVVESEDCNIMSGDIKKAYGEDQIFKLSMIGEDYTVEPVYSEEVLRQIQNATMVNTVAYASGKMVDQDINQGILKSTYTIRCESPIIGGKRILTGSSEDPSPEEVLVNSRLVVTGDIKQVTVGSTPQWEFVDPKVGSEVIGGGKIHTLNDTNPITMFYTNVMHGNTSPRPDINFMTGLSFLNFFNYHPCVWYCSQVLNASNEYVNERDFVFFDVDNYALVDDHDVAKLHNTAMLSLLDVPQLGRVQ